MLNITRIDEPARHISWLRGQFAECHEGALSFDMGKAVVG